MEKVTVKAVLTVFGINTGRATPANISNTFIDSKHKNKFLMIVFNKMTV